MWWNDGDKGNSKYLKKNLYNTAISTISKCLIDLRSLVSLVSSNLYTTVMCGKRIIQNMSVKQSI